MKYLVFKFIIERLLSLIIIILFIFYKYYKSFNDYYVIINRGKIDFKELFNSKYSIGRLYLELKKRNISSINYVDYGFIDKKKKIHLFVGDSYYPLPIIVDGKVDVDSLFQINKDKEWLVDLLNDEGIYLENIIYSFYKNNEIIFIKR